MTDAPKNILQLDLQSYYRVGVNPPILQDIQRTIGSGEHWLLMGSNGAGKSSLLEILAGDIWPSRGSVRVLGHLYGECDKRVLKRRMGVVSPAISASIPGHELGRDIASSGAEARLGSFGPPKTADRARGCAALARVNAEHCSEKRFQIMSQGERQRVMIARAPGGIPVYLRDLVDVLPGYQNPPNFLNFFSTQDDAGEWRRSRAITLAVQMRPGGQVAKFGVAIDEALAEVDGVVEVISLCVRPLALVLRR